MTRHAEARHTERRQQMTALALFLALATQPGCPAGAPTPPTPEPTPTTARPPAPKPTPKPARAFGDARTIYTSELGGAWRHTLLGVDAARGEALIRAELPGEAPRFVIDTIDLRTGARRERWEASPERARQLVGGYPRFVAPTGEDAAGLARFAALLARSGPWSTREAPSPLTVRPSPRGDRILRGVAPANGQDGDWLMLHDAQGAKVARLDVGLAASYAPNFSADGKRVAWIGSHARYAQRGARVGYVLHVADLSTTPPTITPIPTVRDEIRAPFWSADGAWLFALGRVGARRCLYSVEVATLTPYSLWCSGAPIDAVLLANDRSVLIHQAPQRAGDKHALFTVFAGAPGRPSPRLDLQGVTGLGPFGLPHGAGRALVFTRHGQGLALVDLTSRRVVAEHVRPADSFLTGRHTARVVGEELIMLEHRGARVALVGLRVP